MKTLISKSVIIKAAVVVLISASFAAQADLIVQSAQLKEDGALFVKGKLTGNAVDRVYVVDALSNLYVGTINTYAGGRQFNSDLFMASDAAVPCMIKVQTDAPGQRGRRSRTAGDFDISEVRHAPARCNN